MRQPPGIQEFLINKTKWDELPADLKAIVKNALLAEIMRMNNASIDLESKAARDLIEKHGSLPANDAVLVLHHPSPQVAQDALQARRHPAWRRVKFDELLAQQLSMRIHRDRRRAAGAPALAPRRDLTQALLARLPFDLTRAQRRAWREIESDLARPHPIDRKSTRLNSSH